MVITSLISRSMPRICYCIGDRAALFPDRPGDCGLGRQQRLSRLTGRATDVFRRRDRGMVDGRVSDLARPGSGKCRQTMSNVSP